MDSIIVGQKMHQPYQGEGAYLEYADGALCLFVSLSNISPIEKHVLQQGKVSVGLCMINGLVYLSYKVGKVLSGEAVFYQKLYQLLGKPQKAPTKARPGESMPFFIVVNDGMNICRAMRVATLNSSLTNKFCDYWEQQERMTLTRNEYLEEAARVYKFYSSKQIAKKCVDWYTLGDYE